MCSGDASQKTPRQVLLCFLDIARIFGKRKDYTGPLPDLVKFEHVSFELEIFLNFYPFFRKSMPLQQGQHQQWHLVVETQRHQLRHRFRQNQLQHRPVQPLRFSVVLQPLAD